MAGTFGHALARPAEDRFGSYQTASLTDLDQEAARHVETLADWIEDRLPALMEIREPASQT